MFWCVQYNRRVHKAVLNGRDRHRGERGDVEEIKAARNRMVLLVLWEVAAHERGERELIHRNLLSPCFTAAAPESTRAPHTSMLLYVMHAAVDRARSERSREPHADECC